MEPSVLPSLSLDSSTGLPRGGGVGPELRVLHVLISLDPGGMENGVVNLAAGLRPRGILSQFACLERRGTFADRLPSECPVRILGKGRGFSPAATWRLRRLLREWRPHVIHSHNLGSLIYSALATLGGRSMPLLHGEHGQLPRPQRSCWRLFQRRMLYRVCARVHAVSQGLLDHLVEMGLPAERLIALVNGVDTQRFAPSGNAEARLEVRKSLGLPPAAKVLGIVGRLCHNKGHRVLLAAFERVAARNPEFQLLVVGDGGPDRDSILGAYQDSPFRDRIHLAGQLTDPAPAYQALDLLVAPSLVEGLSNVVLEAMSCGCPVLAHVACGNSEVITSNRDGWVADLSCAENLTIAVEEVFRDEQRFKAVRTQARERILEGFSLERMVADYESVYRQLALNSGRSEQ